MLYFDAHAWQPWLLVAIYALCCGFRRDRQTPTDCFVFGFFILWLARGEITGSVSKGLSAFLPNFVIFPWSSAFSLASSFTAALISIILWLRWGHNSKPRSAEPLPPNSRRWSSTYPKPWIFPCRTTHARVFPKVHAFGYSYLQCGYPIIPTATTTTGIDISDGKDQEMGIWWMRVKADDYLERGNGRLGFYNKLQNYLREQHVKDVDWSYAYLITAPRFLGYAFNPVSFWYIYDRGHELRWMILEVNNTFDERRMYLLDGSSQHTPPGTPSPQRLSNSAESKTKLSDKTTSKFTNIWTKDFHVSPFNSRKGSYALKALNPFPYVSHDSPTVDNTITLRSSKDHAKLVARLFSTGKAIDPHKLGFRGTSHFVLSWWWVGFVTFPRILREAFKLFTKRKLHVWLRPEVLNSSIGRLPTASEVTLHNVLHDYLVKLVQEKEDTFCITLKTAIPTIPTRLITNTNRQGNDTAIQNLEIHILSPAFYSRLVHYTSLSEAIDRECIFTDEKNRTLWICSPQLVPLLLSNQKSRRDYGKDISTTTRTYLDEVRWECMKKLRCPPSPVMYSTTPTNSSHTVKDIRSRPYSELDIFVRNLKDGGYTSDYRRIVTKLFLAKRFCFGFVEIIDFADLLMRIMLSNLGAMQLIRWRRTNGNAASHDDCKQLETQRDMSTCMGATNMDWWSFSKAAGLICAIHAYGLLKGRR